MVMKKLHPGAKWVFRVSTYMILMLFFILTLWIVFLLLISNGNSYWVGVVFYLFIFIT
jgi:hypothetical protein